MPFTLAHPAAILPLRKYCPKVLNLPALVFGSLVPDVGYFFGRWNVDEYSHALVGSVVFGLPVGAMLLAVFFLGRTTAVQWLPPRHRAMLEPLCRRPIGSFVAIVLSLLIGIWTHLVFDSFTHKGGWLVDNWSVLNQSLINIRHRNFRVHHVVWYACTFGGTAWLCFAYDHALRSSACPARTTPTWLSWRNGLFIAALLLPIAVFHHSVGGVFSLIAVGVLSLLVVVVAIWLLGKPAESSS